MNRSYLSTSWQVYHAGNKTLFMKKYIIPIALLNLILLFFYFNYSVIKKEKLLTAGQLVLLELAPVDPRSLIQGDYMALRYGISNNINADSIARRGYCIVKINANKVAERIRFQEELTPLNSGEYPIAYTSPDKWRIHLGAESFFFQEGHAAKYEAAKYGALKIDKKGNSLLIGLYDEHLKEIR